MLRTRYDIMCFVNMCFVNLDTRLYTNFDIQRSNPEYLNIKSDHKRMVRRRITIYKSVSKICLKGCKSYTILWKCLLEISGIIMHYDGNNVTSAFICFYSFISCRYVFLCWVYY